MRSAGARLAFPSTSSSRANQHSPWSRSAPRTPRGCHPASSPGVVLADEVYGSTASFRQGVSALGLDYAAAVRATTPVRPPLDKRRARLWRGQDAALSVRALRAPLGVADVARRQRAGVERTLRRDPGARRSRRGRGRTDAAARVGVTDPVGY